MCIPVAIKHTRLYFVSSFYFDVQEERPFTCHCSLLMPRLMSTLAYKDQSTYFTGNETNTLQSTPVLFFFFFATLFIFLSFPARLFTANFTFPSPREPLQRREEFTVVRPTSASRPCDGEASASETQASSRA